MDEKRFYHCEKCGEQAEITEENSPVPECCNQPMLEAKDLQSCMKSSTAEHSRLEQMDEPCDDGRSGKI